MKNIKDYMDKKGYIVQKTPGKQNMIDSNFLTVNLLYQKMFLGHSEWFDGRNIKDVATSAVMDFSSVSGGIRRYWRNFDDLEGANILETARYTDTSTVSRDNSMGYISLLGKLGHHVHARKILLEIVKRGSFFQNTVTVKGVKKTVPDLCGPSQYAIILRSCFSNNTLFFLFPLICVLDTFLFLNQLVHVLQSYYDPTHTSTIHHRITSILRCRDTIQTPFSYLSEKLLVKCRKKVYSEFGTLESATRYYSRSVYDAPIYDITKEVEEEIK